MCYTESEKRDNMIFSDIRVKDIRAILHYTPQIARFTAKNRNDHIIGIQLNGRAKHYFADREFTLEENCLYFFNQNEDYKVEVAEKGLCFSIHFTTFVPIDTKSFCIKIKDNISVVGMLERIEGHYKKSGGCTTKLLCDFYKLLGIFEEIHSREYKPQNEKLLKAKEYLTLHFKEKNCVARAAEEYGVTSRRFNDVFKQSFHTTPNRYIIIHKINLARKLLGIKELSVGEVSDMCGFEDIYYFSKTFKKLTGQTASSFKKQAVKEK